MHGSDESNAPLIGIVQKQHMVYHRESFLQGLISTSFIMPKPNLRPISHPKSHKFRENTPPPSNQHPQPIGTVHCNGAPHTPHALIFSFHHRSPQSLPLSRVTPKSFSQKSWLNKIKFLTPKPPGESGVQILD